MKKIAAVIIIVFWVTMMSLLIKREIIDTPERLVHSGYRAILAPGRQDYTSRMGVHFQSGQTLRRVGHITTSYHYLEDGTYRIDTDASIHLSRIPPESVPGLLLRQFGHAGGATDDGGQPDSRDVLSTRTATHINWNFSFDSATVHVTLGPEPLLNLRAVASDHEMIFTLGPMHNKQEYRLPFDPSSVFATGLSPFHGVPSLSVGRKWSVAVVDPFAPAGASQQHRVSAEVVREETLLWQEKNYKTYVVVAKIGLLSATGWITEDGDVLQQKTVFGLTLIKEPVHDKP